MVPGRAGVRCPSCETKLTSPPPPCHQGEDLSRHFSTEFLLSLVGHCGFWSPAAGTKGSPPGTVVLLPTQQGSEEHGR